MRLVLTFLLMTLAGCATTPVYNPMTDTGPRELWLNQKGLNSVQEGMTQDQVHDIMGQQLAIGYYAQTSDYKPLTIPNPYKAETIKGTAYVIEYYVDSIRQPDGVISDNELTPLVFKDGKLVGRGWPLSNSLHQPAA
jgi:hypothetical protein